MFWLLTIVLFRYVVNDVPVQAGSQQAQCILVVVGFHLSGLKRAFLLVFRPEVADLQKLLHIFRFIENGDLLSIEIHLSSCTLLL